MQKNNLFLDLDRERIRTIVSEAYTICQSTLETDFLVSVEDLLSKVNMYLDTNRISIEIRLDLPSRKYPGMVLEINLQKKKIFARIPSHARNHPKQVLVNRFLKAL